MGQHSWKEWKQQARSVATKKEIAFIPKVQQFIFDMIKPEIDPSRGRNLHNKGRIMKTNIEDYDDTFWQNKFETQESGKLLLIVSDEKVQGLRKLMGSKWQDVKYNLCQDQAQLAQKQEWKIDTWLSVSNLLDIEMIHDAIAKCNIKPKPKCADIMEGLVSTPDVDEEILDDNWKRVWEMSPWKQPAIKIWVKILTHFEGLNETTTTNVITELGQTMKQATGKDAATVRSIMTAVDKILRPLSQHFHERVRQRNS